MLNFTQMMARAVISIALGAIMGLEREFAGKEAGVRTEMLVAAGSTLFTLVALKLPYIILPPGGNVSDIIARNSGFTAVIANIVVGIGFLGAGIIIKNQERVHGLTTAALVWTTAAVGILVGIGEFYAAGGSVLLISGLLYLLRKLNLSDNINQSIEKEESHRVKDPFR